MIGKKKNNFDADQIKEVRSRISESVASGSSEWQTAAAQYLLSVVDELKDENESLWFMIDELKSSKMDARHTEILNNKVQKHLMQLRLLQGRKGEA
jgi:hypothetical protein